MEDKIEYNFKEVTPYTMEKLTNIYGAYLNHSDDAFNHIALTALSACAMAATAAVSVHMIGNPELIKENLLRFSILGVCVPVGTMYSSIYNIKKFIFEKKLANKVLDCLNKERMDIPLEMIVEEYEKKCDEDDELNKMIDVSQDPKIIRKIREKWNNYMK